MPHGHIKFYKASSGFGFIIPESGGVDTFFHCADVIRPTRPSQICPGDYVSFDVTTDDKGRNRTVRVVRHDQARAAAESIFKRSVA